MVGILWRVGTLSQYYGSETKLVNQNWDVKGSRTVQMVGAVRICHYHAPSLVPPGTKSSGSRGEGEDLCTGANLLHIFCDVFPLENWKFIFPSCDLIYPLAIVPASHIFLNNQVFLIICLSPLLLPLLSCGPQTWMEEKSWTLPSVLLRLATDAGLGGKHVPASSVQVI